MTHIFIDWLGSAFLIAALIRLSYVDWKTFRLPNLWTKSLILIGLLYSFYTALDFYTYLLGAVLGYAIFWSIETVYRVIRKREGLGRGDAKLLAAGGAWCGALALPFIILIASSAGLIYILMKPEEARADMRLPFGPFLAAGIAITYISLKLFNPLG